MRKLIALAVLLCASLPVRAETLLVLPFFNLSRNSNLDWIGESLAEAVHDALAAERALVLDRDDRDAVYRRLSIRPYSRLTKASVFVVGEALDANRVVYGSFQFTPPAAGATGRGSLRITAQILNISDRSAGPEYLEMGALEDLARLQTHLAWQTLQFLVPDEAPSDQEFQKRQPVYRVEAIENFIRGVVAVQPDLKLKFFQQAVRIEPMYSQANYELGRLYLQRKNYRAAADTLSKVLPSDPHCREALFHLGLSRYNLNEFDAAQMAFLKVAEDVPLNEVFNNLGAAQTRSNPAEALKNFQKALEGDPNDPDYHFNVGYALLRSGRYGEAAERFRSVLDRVPGDPVATTLLGRCIKGSSSRASGGVPENLERLKGNFEETAYRQLKAVLEVKK